MERTMSFSDWVNEYKPIEFNENVSHIIDVNGDSVNIIGKYLINGEMCLGFPDNHTWIVWQMMHNMSGALVPVRRLDYLVTRKSRIEHEDKIIIDFSKEPGRHFFKILLEDM